MKARTASVSPLAVPAVWALATAAAIISLLVILPR
jgi:hypothetical protein